MTDDTKTGNELFDDWPERYDQWFQTPIGALVKKYESRLVRELLSPRHDDHLLDVGCGTAVFTLDLLPLCSRITGLDISLPMLQRAAVKTGAYPFKAVAGDMRHLPFADNTFDKTVSITALEFIADGRKAVRELFRVTRKGGVIVAATLNRLSPWATRRRQAAAKGHAIFKSAVFRSPDDLRSLAPVEPVVKSAVHFEKDANPAMAPDIEDAGNENGLMTGAFLAARWEKAEVALS